METYQRTQRLTTLAQTSTRMLHVFKRDAGAVTFHPSNYFLTILNPGTGVGHMYFKQTPKTQKHYVLQVRFCVCLVSKHNVECKNAEPNRTCK